MSLKEELQSLVKGEVLNDEKTLKKYSRDASLFEVKPRFVIFPKNAKDIQNLVLFVAKRKKEKLSLTARSAGTDMSGGPLAESIILDFTKYFNKIKKIGKDYAVVQPGMYYRDFEKQTLRHNLMLPSYPASREICAIGGMVGNNGGGEDSLAYGKTENFVQELKVILQDGKVYTLKALTKAELRKKIVLKTWEGKMYRDIYNVVKNNSKLLQEAKPKVSKNSAGYYLWNIWDGETFDLTKLFTGSQGTLGIITEVKFRLVKPKKHATLLVIFLKDLKFLPVIISRVLEKKPESFESYDDNTLKLALRFFPDFVKLLKTNIISLGWQFLPEFGMLLRGGMPKLVMYAEFNSDDAEEASAHAREAQESLKDLRLNTHITKSDKEVQKYFTIRRQSFALLRQHMKGKRTAPFIDDFVIRPEYLPEFFPKIWRILDPYKKYMRYTIAGHVGDGNFHIIPLMDMENPESRKIIPVLMKKVHKLIFQYKGTFTGEHNDGLIRSPYLKDMYGEEVYKLFVKTKKIFDPNTVFNPGKKVGADLQYSLEHMATTNE
ncbi:FAD-binding oxidoreductase [Patescibacteria group bacterium]|nr:FAD-binding oxidoreductase [Patescibacteria group bacterium]